MRKFLPFIPPALLLCFLLLNLGLFFTGRGQSRRVLFFPLDSGNGQNGEIRNMRLEKGMEKELKAFVEELLLGPVSLEMNPVAPPGTRLESILYRDGQAYLDFSRELALNNGQFQLDCQKSMELIRENLLFNFPRIQNLVITVDGQLPYSGFFAF